jgi:DNA-directed RNA polymerase specialized sigma24 family protein
MENGDTGNRESQGQASMLSCTEETQQLLRQIVSKLTPDHWLREDLVQEASIHLWLQEQEHPGQTQSWYFQSCRFFVQNRLRNGRSVDSVKRSPGACSMAEFEERVESGAERTLSCEPVLSTVSAREILSSLEKWLTPLERRVFVCLAEGLGIRQVSLRLKVSHTSVIRHRRKIATLALTLGIEPPPERRAWHKNAH